MAGLGVDLELDAATGDHPERRSIGGEALRIRRYVVWPVGAGADNVAGLHAVFLAKELWERGVAALGFTELPAQRGNLGVSVLCGEVHGVAHMEQRARAESAHVIGCDICIARHNADRLCRDV